MKFLVDMPVTPQAVAYLEAAGHEAVHASSVGLSSASDARILEVAHDEGRVVVTVDLDYRRLVAAAKAAGHPVSWRILFRRHSELEKVLTAQYAALFDHHYGALYGLDKLPPKTVSDLLEASRARMRDCRGAWRILLPRL